ncbi:MAG: hypothetical protein JNL87_10870, partial [Burkholderiaceae bacterium]|nr:hypothetical protein [Burkholderiaceae bacterium]
ATGAAVPAKTITLGGAFGTPYTYNHAGLQVVPSAFTLGTTAVPAGSRLVFNGYANPDRIVAVDPADGSVIASLALAGNYDLTAGLYDATSGHLFITDNSSVMREIDPLNGAQVGANIALPINVQSWAGIAIDPLSGNFWIGSSGGGARLVEIRRDGSEVRRIDTVSQGLDQGEISGLAFAPDGKLWVASTQGVIYRITT